MSEFKSSPRRINASAEAVYDKLSNLEGFREILANVPSSAIPAEQREMLDQITVTSDSISFPAGPVGQLTMKVSEKIRPTTIRMEGQGTPVAMSMTLELASVAETECEAAVALDVAIPPMLKPMIGGTLQKMADQFADVLQQLKYE